MFYGGRHERSRRAGTENVAGIVGLGKAAELARAGFANGEVERIRMLRDRLERTITETIDQVGVNSAGAPRVPNTTNIYFDCIEGEALVIALDLKGVAVSTGAACSSGAIEPSHVLTAMGLSRRPRPRQPALSASASRTPARMWTCCSPSCPRPFRGCGS